MAAAAHERLMAQGWQAIGFDHVARPGDPMARAAQAGRIQRNFQGFTDDDAPTMIGLGASAISRFNHALTQNEHHAGRYALRVGNGVMPSTRGVATPPPERRIGRAISALLCQSEAALGGLPGLTALRAALAPFEARGLVEWDGDHLRLSEDARPYARSIAALLDPWRSKDARRFSSAV